EVRAICARHCSPQYAAFASTCNGLTARKNSVVTPDVQVVGALEAPLTLTHRFRSGDGTKWLTQAHWLRVSIRRHSSIFTSVRRMRSAIIVISHGSFCSFD